MPAEPPSSRFKDKVCQPGYPALEYGGLVFAYMGPPDLLPELPRYDGLHQEGTVLSAYRNFSRGIVPECNWLQIQENVMDPVHTAFLHALNNRVHFTDVYKTLPELDFGETPMGMKYVRTARLPNGRTFVRVQEIVMPNVRVVSETQVGGEPMSERARGRLVGARRRHPHRRVPPGGIADRKRPAGALVSGDGASWSFDNDGRGAYELRGYAAAIPTISKHR